MSLLSRRLYFFLFQRKLFILFSISILIFWNSINLANVSQLGNKHLVSDYIVTSQRESHSLPDMAFLLTFNYFVPFGVIKKRFIKINFNYFNRNCDYSSCPGWWIIFLYAPSHKGYAFWKDCLWTSLSFLYSLKIICILLRQVIKKMVVLSVLFTILISWSPICIPLILLSELMRLKKLFNPKTLINFRNSLKISLSQDLLCSHNKQKNWAQCALPPPPCPQPMANRVKSVSTWVNVNRMDFNYLLYSDNFAFGGTTQNTNNLLHFSFSTLNAKPKKL